MAWRATARHPLVWGAVPSSSLTPDRRARIAALHSATHHSAFRYLLVGLGMFALDFGLLVFLFDVLGMPLWLATATAFWSSVGVNFALQRRFTFRAAGPVGTAAWRYGALLAANSVANVLVIELFERTGLGYAVGKVTVTVLQAAWNYLAYRHWVFVSPGSEPRATTRKARHGRAGGVLAMWQDGVAEGQEHTNPRGGTPDDGPPAGS